MESLIKITFIIAFLISTLATAHSGRTDSSGGYEPLCYESDIK